MTSKPTCEELHQRLAALEAETAKCADALKAEKAARSQAEEAHREAEERYQRLTETVTDYVYTVQIRGGRPEETIHGRACAAVTGYTSEDFKRNPYLWIEMVYEADRDIVNEHVRQTLAGIKVGPVEHRIIRKDGAQRWVRNTPVMHFDEKDKLVSYDGLVQDITELKHAQEMIRYKELFENVVDGVFILTLDGRFVEANDMVYEKTGYSRKDLQDLRLQDLVDRRQVSYVEKLIDEIREETVLSFELTLQTKEGRHFPVSANCRLISYLGAESILAVARDITRAKLLEDQLIRSERLAATGQLAASIAHEINSPLQGVTSLLRVMEKANEADEALAGNLDLVRGAFESISRTVRKLLDLNRPGKERKQPTEVNEVIKDTVSLVRGLLTRRKVSVDLNLSPRIPIITASPQQLGQVMMNLINNAVEAIAGMDEARRKAAPADGGGGEIHVRTNLRKGHVIITVADTGPGISPEDLTCIFDPFYTRKKSMGMGIGLSLCHGIIEDHGGTILAENAPEGGALFTITLPVR